MVGTQSIGMVPNVLPLLRRITTIGYGRSRRRTKIIFCFSLFPFDFDSLNSKFGCELNTIPNYKWLLKFLLSSSTQIIIPHQRNFGENLPLRTLIWFHHGILINYLAIYYIIFLFFLLLHKLWNCATSRYSLQVTLISHNFDNVQEYSSTFPKFQIRLDT